MLKKLDLESFSFSNSINCCRATCCITNLLKLVDYFTELFEKRDTLLTLCRFHA